jgi:hypothetical protein
VEPTTEARRSLNFVVVHASRRRVAALAAAVALLVVLWAALAVFIAIVVAGYVWNWGWTGFRGNTLWTRCSRRYGR